MMLGCYAIVKGSVVMHTIHICRQSLCYSGVSSLQWKKVAKPSGSQKKKEKKERERDLRLCHSKFSPESFFPTAFAWSVLKTFGIS